MPEEVIIIEIFYYKAKNPGLENARLSEYIIIFNICIYMINRMYLFQEKEPK